VPNVVLVFLQDEDEGFRVSNKLLLADPAVTRLESLTGAYFVANNLQRDELAKELYDASCSAEQKILHNFLKILKTATTATSLMPYFSQGHVALLGKFHKICAWFYLSRMLLFTFNNKHTHIQCRDCHPSYEICSRFKRAYRRLQKSQLEGRYEAQGMLQRNPDASGRPY
jgi:thiosulfate reductase cytochrome b subunit